MAAEKRYRASDRFMPCLLSRLTDLNPQARTEAFSRSISLKQLKRDILRNIEMILNSRSHRMDGEARSDPVVGSSVLMLGVADFCGASHSDEAIGKLEEEIAFQLTAFEPRIVAGSIHVSLTVPVHSQPGIFQLEISGRIELSPLRGEFLFKSHIDLENGAIVMEENRNEDEFFRLLS